MADIQEIDVKIRDQIGTGGSRAIRRDGNTPGILYGTGIDPINITVETKVLVKHFQTGRFLSTLYDLNLDGKKTRVIPKDVQLHPVKDTPLHVDFLLLSKEAKVVVEVPVSFINDDICPGIKKGGVLNVVRYNVELSCPADAIPENIVVDLSEADTGDSIHISAVTLSEDVTPTITDRDFTIATIAAPAGITEEADETEEVEDSEAQETSDDEDSQE